jgi:NAD(P)-dependent dehydrogenase (short-subunit alcohol dehydrogenase family)
MNDLHDRVVLVTGAGRGIGRALAAAFAEHGARVAANDITPVNLDPAVAAMTVGGGAVRAWVADVSNKMAVQTMIEEVRDAFGRIAILINNAAVEPHASLLAMDEWDWDRTLGVNLKGPFLTSQSVGRVMADQGGGVIVNIASVDGRAHGLAERAAYVASKTGLIGLTRESARELAAYNIRVNAVCPGEIESDGTRGTRGDEDPMSRWLNEIPLRRLGRPEDMVGLVLFLCSEAAAYITGQAFHVDGGKVMV